MCKHLKSDTLSLMVMKLLNIVHHHPRIFRSYIFNEIRGYVTQFFARFNNPKVIDRNMNRFMLLLYNHSEFFARVIKITYFTTSSSSIFYLQVYTKKVVFQDFENIKGHLIRIFRSNETNIRYTFLEDHLNYLSVEQLKESGINTPRELHYEIVEPSTMPPASPVGFLGFSSAEMSVTDPGLRQGRTVDEVSTLPLAANEPSSPASSNVSTEPTVADINDQNSVNYETLGLVSEGKKNSQS